MAVIHGSLARAYMNGYDVGDFFNMVKSSHQRPALENTVLNNNGWKAYAKDISQGKVTASGFFDHDTLAALTAAGKIDADTGDYLLATAVLDAAGANSTFVHFPGGATAVGDRGVGFQGIVTNYEFTTPPDNLAECSMEMETGVPREQLILLTPMTVKTNTATGTTYDYGAVLQSTNLGGAVYLMADDWTSGTATITVEHSVDGSAWTTLATFANITADHKHERIAIPTIINRYVRFKAITTFVDEFLVAIHRKL